MHRHPKLKGFADTRRFNTSTDATPEGGVQQDYIHGSIQDVRGELFEADDYRVRRQWNANLFACPAHPVHSEHGIFQIIVLKALDGLAEANRLLRGPNS